MGWRDWVRLAAPVRRERDEPGSPIYRSGRITLISYNEVVSAEAALKHPVIARCVRKIAESVQSVRWFAELDPDASAADRANKATVIADLNALLNSPTDGMSGDELRFWMGMNYALYSRFAFKVGVGTRGTANGIYPLVTRWVSAEMNGRGLLSHYNYGEGENKETLPLRRKARDGASYAYQVAMPNLDAAFMAGRNTGTLNQLCSIGLPAQIITVLLRRAIDTAEGHPNSKYIVTSEKVLTKSQKKALVEHLEGMEPGEDDSGNVLMLANVKVEVHKLDNNLSDIHSKMPMDDMARMIAGAFGIPIALLGLGAADGARFASNYTESRRAFWADTIIPGYLAPFATGLTKALCPPGVRVRFDYDTIDALRDHNVANAKELESVTFLSLDEKRELVGFEPMKSAETQAVPSPSSGPQQAANQPPQNDNEDQ
ncbi:portal protein [Synechococcus phage Ssp-JY38]|nr:portal protein [Synechococcus phage Yong-L2-223]